MRVPSPIMSAVSELQFPVLLWRKGYSFVASSPLELCTHPRSLVVETQKLAAAGEFTVADSAGRIYKVKEYEQVPPFGGLMRLPHLVLRSVYAAPVLGEVTQPSLAEFINTLSNVLGARFGKSFKKTLLQAQSYGEAMALVAKRESKAG
ncbi:hypothetical protein DAPPUDRAFT_276547 [Daphnia pulex]|uniref:Uncharacterized protein n=2 Tax=cellular organisms TaxID=131567 RepID=E9I5X6_DAPPU|nr:hypothetical protein DAPPUDRAFT_276547 [Daphnia pulex]|eukprot:EFX60604.1 hypothetical protein DAPPUDRAFT_276547 [Daphnia pulex]